MAEIQFSPLEINPSISRLLRGFTFIEVLVLVSAGVLLFFLPDIARPEWPWALTPFNTRFLGGVYLSALTAVGLMFWVGRWNPTRPVLWMIFVFTGVILVVSLVYLDRFDLHKWGTWVWFAIYIGLPANAAVHLWLYRHLPPAQAFPVKGWVGGVILIFAVLYSLYGLGLLVLPNLFSSFWPWRLDVFHSQLYCAAFLTVGVGLWVVSRQAAARELVAVGLVQATQGFFAILGLFIVDSQVHKVAWSHTGTWMWIGMFAIFALVGVGMIVKACSRIN